MGRKARNTLAQSGRLESQKISGGGRSVFLDFSFYRTYQDLASMHTSFTLPLIIAYDNYLMCAHPVHQS
jgi:hypothetical protein